MAKKSLLACVAVLALLAVPSLVPAAPAASAPVAPTALGAVGGQMLATVPLGGAPRDVAYLPALGRAFAPLSTGEVVAADLATGQVVARAAVGGNPEGVAVDPLTLRVYVATLGGAVHVLDAVTLAPVATWDFALPAYGVAVDPARERVWIASLGGPGVPPAAVALDARTGAVQAAIPVDYPPWSVVVDPATGRAYVQTTITVHVIDERSFAVLEKIYRGVPLLGVGVNPSRGEFYVSWYHAGYAGTDVYDAFTFAKRGEVDTRGFIGSIVAHPVTGRAYFGAWSGRVHAVDPPSRAPSWTATFGGVWGLAVDPLAGRLVVADASARALLVTVG